MFRSKIILAVSVAAFSSLSQAEIPEINGDFGYVVAPEEREKRPPRTLKEGQFLEGSYDQYELIGSFAYKTSDSIRLTAKIRLTANLGYIDRNLDGGSDVNDVTALLGASYRLNDNWSFVRNFGLENDITKDETWSLTSTYKKFTFGAANDDTVFLTYRFRLS